MQSCSPGRRPCDAAIESHARDLDMVLPWARLVFGKALLNRATTPEQELGWTEIPRIFFSLPTLADTPDRCENGHRRTHDSPRALGYRQRRTERSPDTNRCDHRESRPFCCSLWSVGSPPFHRSSSSRRRCSTRWSSVFSSTPTRQLLSIGYRVADGALDPSCYDLLASEARLASFVAIAKGDVPPTPLVPPGARG